MMFPGPLPLRALGVFTAWGILALGRGCREGLPIDNSDEAAFTGITQTTEDGTIISNDPDDWRSISTAGLYLQPAYPNPCVRSMSFTLAFRLSRPDSLVITLNDTPNHIARTVISETVDAGSIKFKPAVTYMNPQVYRLYIRVIRPDTVFTTYGDIDLR